MGSWQLKMAKTFKEILEDLKKADKKRYKKLVEKLELFTKELLEALEKGKPVSKKYRLHQLQNFRYKGILYPDAYDAHLGGDTLLIFLIDKSSKTVIYLFLGSHSELFK